MASKIHTIPTEVARAYNAGYTAGYNRAAIEVNSTPDVAAVYLRAYITGMQDRLEDEEDIQLGEFDILTEEERLAIYGDESP